MQADMENDAQDDITLNPSMRPVDMPQEPDSTASPLFLVFGILTLILLLGITALTLTQYLDFEHKVQIYEYTPGLPHAK
jgi:hypothetical protein